MIEHPITAVQPVSTFWTDACLAISLSSLMANDDGNAFKAGFHIRANAGPVLDAWLNNLRNIHSDVEFRVLTPTVSLEALIGGIDLSATLAERKMVRVPGFLSRAGHGFTVIYGAERLEPEIVHHLALSIEDVSFPHHPGLVLIDEGGEDQEVSQTLSDLMDFHIDLRPVAYAETKEYQPQPPMPGQSRALCDEDRIMDVCNLAGAMGIHSMRPPMQAMRIAIANAGNNGRSFVVPDDVSVAARLSLLNRASALPQTEDVVKPEDASRSPQPDSCDGGNSDQDSVDNMPPEDMTVDIEGAELPAELVAHAIARLATQKRVAGPGKAESSQRAGQRGRPVTSRRGKPERGKKLDIVATLRAAVPWQKLRSQRMGNANGVCVLPQDFHVRRYKLRSETVTLFVVDASGSTALNRLGEAKGAVERLLGESYATRDQVALVAFRKSGAELLLPPTRSLARAKRNLSSLPGGGGTPLASGLEKALSLALEQMKTGRNCRMVLLTDGSANIALDGSPGRMEAMADALSVCRQIREQGISVTLIDVGIRASNKTRDLADALGARHVPMPFTSSRNLLNALSGPETA